MDTRNHECCDCLHFECGEYRDFCSLTGEEVECYDRACEFFEREPGRPADR